MPNLVVLLFEDRPQDLVAEVSEPNFMVVQDLVEIFQSGRRARLLLPARVGGFELHGKRNSMLASGNDAIATDSVVDHLSNLLRPDGVVVLQRKRQSDGGEDVGLERCDLLLGDPGRDVMVAELLSQRSTGAGSAVVPARAGSVSVPNCIARVAPGRQRILRPQTVKADVVVYGFVTLSKECDVGCAL